MRYIKQLDSLRAIAVILVIICHWTPQTNIVNRFPNGAMGVDFFFVLSGFLISNILFTQRNIADLYSSSKSTLIKIFYIRRALRIFPIYYLTIFLILFFSEISENHNKEAFFYYLFYASNFYFFKIQSWDGMLSHLWSLAVEEQFYLIWPWMLFYVNKKYLLFTISFFIMVGTISQILLSKVPYSSILTICCFDAFGLGALLAWIINYSKNKLSFFYKSLSICAVIACLFFLYGVYSFNWILPERTVISIISIWLITYILVHINTDKLKFKFIFNNQILIFLGKISYGLYLYHNIIPQTLNSKIINKYLNPLLPNILYKKYWGQLFLVENIFLLILISWLFYILFESRFLKLKKYFIAENPKVQLI